jgi:hypothetical protein
MADNWLKEYRFTAVQLPRRNLAPADVMYRGNGNFDQKVGNLQMLFSADRVLPATSSGEPTINISRLSERKFDASLGARILGVLLGGGASSKFGANLEAKHARSLSITYEDVTQDSLAVLELQSWLEGAEIRSSRQATGWLNDEKLAAVTAVLRTARLSVVAERENGASIELSVPEIEGLIGADAKVSAASGSSSKISFTGKEPVAFGFQAFRMNFEGNVSFGLEETFGGAAEDDVNRLAWRSDNELHAIEDRALPTD